MSLPKLGRYTSADGTINIEIAAANPTNGQIGGQYDNQNSPEGPIKHTSDTFGQYRWVATSQMPYGQAPFCILFSGAKRPEGFPYCVVDNWNGVYQEGDTMLLTGSRTYVNEKGAQVSESMGTHVFSFVS